MDIENSAIEFFPRDDLQCGLKMTHRPDYIVTEALHDGFKLKSDQPFVLQNQNPRRSIVSGVLEPS